MLSGSLMSKCSRIISTLPALLAALVISAAAPAAHAQRLLTLDEALTLARRNNRDLQQARARVDQSRAGVETAWVALLPNVAVQGKYTHNYKEVTLDFSGYATLQGLQGSLTSDLTAAGISAANTAGDPALAKLIAGDAAAIANYIAKNPGATSLFGSSDKPIVIQKEEQLDFALTAVIPLLVPYAYPTLNAAKKTVEASRYNLSASEATVLFATAQAYYACAGMDELVGARQHALAVAKQALDNAKARLEAGVVNRVEVSRAELQLVRAEQALVETEDSEASAYRSLATIMNMHEPVRVEPNQAAAMVELATDKMTSDALRLRPEFHALEMTIAASDSTVSANKWRWAPQVSGFGNLRAFNYAGFSGDNYAWALGLQLDWTLYDGGLRDAQRHLAWAQRAESEARLEALRDSVADDVYNAARTLKTKRRAVETASRSVELSKETLDLVNVQHEAGTATQLDLLQAQDNLVAAEVALAQARFDLSLGALSLDRVSGAFPLNRSLK